MKKKRQAEVTTKAGTEPEIIGLRIVGGSLRGRKLEYSGDLRTRPMKDRVREAVFNLLGTTVVGARVIDLFAGTGAMAIESISRGAASAICIERHYPTTKLIDRGAEELGIAERMSAVFSDAFFWSKSFVLADSAPLIVFCCPPYDFYVDRNAEMLTLIERWINLCPPRSMVVVEADERFDFKTLPHADAWDLRTYPPAFVGIWEHKVAS